MLNTIPQPRIDFPRAKTKRQVSLVFIWALPAIAALVATVLVMENLQKFGPSITIEFDDASGLEANQTVIRYRGVRVGSVHSIELAKNLQRVYVHARLVRSAAGLARTGSIFWIVRPEVGAAGVHALETIVSGPYIEALPGNGQGRPEDHFLGAAQSPILRQGNGLEFVLHGPQIRSLGADSPVYYRGLQAGNVLYLDLSPDSTSVNVHVFIRSDFTPLIRTNTVWWNAGGIAVSWHLLSGVSMTAENLKSVVTGGISFATPDVPAEPAMAGTTFVLYEKPEDKWLAWSPHISLTNTMVLAPGNPGSAVLENVSQPAKQ
jgi:paraquat-inducible protein B